MPRRAVRLTRMRAAYDGFGALTRAKGGSMSHSATYPGTYRAMAAQRRMLENA